MTLVRVKNTGTLDRDTEYGLIGNGNYTDAKNVRLIHSSQNESIAWKLIEGNEAVIDLPTADASSKTYRIFFTWTAGATYATTVRFYDKNNNLLNTGSPAFVTGASLILHYGAIVTYLTGIFSGLSCGAFTATSATTGYFDIEYLSAGTDEWYIKTSDTDLFYYREFTEAISATEQLYYRGSKDMDNETFVALGSESGIGQIGRITVDEFTRAVTYTRLIQTKKFKFGPDEVVDIEVERDNNSTNIYLTDNTNTPKVLYHTGTLGEDCFLWFQDGDYDYQNFEETASLMQVSASAKIEFVEIVENAGSISPGNKLYTGRFLSASVQGATIITPTGDIMVPVSDIGDPISYGGAFNETTSKAVKLQVTNIPAGVFEFFELIVCEQEGEAESYKIVQRVKLEDNQTELTLLHTSNTQATTISIPELFEVAVRIKKAKNIRVLQNRLVLSNVEEDIDSDLDTWAQAFTHTLEEKALTSVGEIGEQGRRVFDLKPKGELKYGEFQDPENVYFYKGHMINETYRYGVQVQWKESLQWSNAYWVDDIRVDTSATNVTTPDRRSASNITGSLCNSDNDEVKSIYVKFANINLDYKLADGTPLRNKIAAFRFVRAEVIPEVIATGMLIKANQYTFGGNTIVNANNAWPLDPTEYPDYDVKDGLGATNNISTAYWRSGTPAFAANNSYGFFISPDYMTLNKQFEFINNSELRVFGPQKRMQAFDAIGNYDFTSAAAVNESAYVSYGGYIGQPAAADATYTAFPITAGQYLPHGAYPELSAGVFIESNLADCVVFKCTGTIAHTNDNTEQYVHYAQYFINRGAHLKYPVQKETTEYHTIGHIYTLDEVFAGTITQDIYGDVFTQKTYAKIKYPWAKGDTKEGFGTGMGFYSQNRCNTQMISRPNTADGFYLFPSFVNLTITDNGGTNDDDLSGNLIGGAINWLEEYDYEQTYNYSKSYNIRNRLALTYGFSVDNAFEPRKPATIYYSMQRLKNAKKDDMRIFRPANYYDLDFSKGAINHMEVVNGELFTWQDRSFNRLYFNQNGVLDASGQDVVLGNSDVIRGDVSLSSFGLKDKRAVVKSINRSGKDLVYWWSPIHKKVCRFSSDGTRVISIKGMSSYFDNLKNVNYEGTAICAFDKYNDEFLLTLKYFHGATKYEAPLPTTINIGDTYYNQGLSFNLPITYECIFAHNPTALTEPGVGANWRSYWIETGMEEHPEFYNLTTLSFDEKRDGWNSPYEFYPEAYLNCGPYLMSVNPNILSEVYLHNYGTPGTFYRLAHTGYMESVANYDRDRVKTMTAIAVQSDSAPYQIDFTTKTHTSDLVAADFDLEEEGYRSTILNDTTGGASNEDDTSRLFGTYLRTKYWFAAGSTQKLFDYIIKFRFNSRDINR